MPVHRSITVTVSYLTSLFIFNPGRIDMSIVQSATSIAESLLAEFESQAPVTRKFLERLPEDKLTWKPHEKSLSAGQLAYHIAAVPGDIVRLVEINPVQNPGPALFPQPTSSREILEKFDASIATARSGLPKFGDAAMSETWRILVGNRELLAMPRAAFVRAIAFSHCYQHRGQLSVYLRLLNLQVPASWGPSADESMS
jgi:uncharacterized damage-inducible protein DinB